MYTAISRKVVGKKARKCTRQDRKVIWAEKYTATARAESNKIIKTRQREFARFLSFQTRGNKVLLAMLNLRKNFKTQIHATVEVKLLKKASREEKQIPYVQIYKLVHFSRQICKILVTFVLFSDKLSRYSCISWKCL